MPRTFAQMPPVYANAPRRAMERAMEAAMEIRGPKSWNPISGWYAAPRGHVTLPHPYDVLCGASDTALDVSPERVCRG